MLVSLYIFFLVSCINITFLFLPFGCDCLVGLLVNVVLNAHYHYLVFLFPSHDHLVDILVIGIVFLSTPFSRDHLVGLLVVILNAHWFHLLFCCS
jgi:hypothetical protein